MRRALVGFASLLAVSAAPALAKPDACALIQAFNGESAQSLAGIAPSVRPDGTIDVSYRNKRTPLVGASDCGLSGPVDIFSLTCNWDTDSDLKGAQRQHGVLMDQIKGCFADGMVLQDYTSSVKGLEVIDFYRGVAVGKDSSEVTVDLEIHRYYDESGVGTDSHYAVILSISR